MIVQRLLALLLAAIFAIITGCNKSESTEQAPGSGTTNATPADPTEPTHAQSKLATIKLYLGPEAIQSEMAITFDQIRTGMMFRTNVAETDSMIFDLHYPQRAAFWMKNCSVPLSVAYIDPDGVIQEIHDLEPHNTNSVVSAVANVRFALEVPQGWFDRHHIRTGTLIRTERGTLMETFGQHP